MMDLIQLGTFILSSGRVSGYKIDCDALSDGTIRAFAHLIRDLGGPFTTVEGIPTGGLRLAAALEGLASPGLFQSRHLIVDDVLTTGASMRRALGARWDGLSPCLDYGWVMFARGPCPRWVRAVCIFPEELWTK